MSEARITIRLTEDDSAWIKAQSEALGLDNEAAVVRMLVRQARLGNVSLSVVMSGLSQCVPPGFTSPITQIPEGRLRLFNQNREFAPSVGDAYDLEAVPVAPDVVEDLLASRLQEMGVDPAAGNGVPLSPAVGQGYAPQSDPNTPAMSLRPAPLRQGRDYR
jgi:hypothetical protein